MWCLRKLGISFKHSCKMESTYPEMCSVNVPLQEMPRLWLHALFVQRFVQVRMTIFGRDEFFKFM